MTAIDANAAAGVNHADMANAIRALAMDAVEKAKSGHPGMPMGMADAATVLFTRHLRYDPAWPDWPDRDRFVLSAGHGSMLLYALLYLTGYPDIDIGEIERFRQLGSRTPGHPEYGHAAGIETTTGPLGQGLANAVGMALAERILAERFGGTLVDHYTYVVAGDGCLMEGISHEAASLAGHLGLARLIVLFDDNRVSIDGPTELAQSEDVAARFRAYGWASARVDGHDPSAVADAIAKARRSDRPTLIACRTTIGFGAPTKAGTADTHGAPLGEKEVAGARQQLGWPHAAFEVPAPILAAWRAAGARGRTLSEAWRRRRDAADAEARAEFERVLAGRLPDGFAAIIDELKRGFAGKAARLATRQSSGEVLERLNQALPELIGGSADLTGSNNTRSKLHRPIRRGDYAGRYLHYGVREHAMAAAMNGLALHRGLIPYAGTFLVFTDYCRPAIRLSALMGQHVIYVMTHDSIGLGEDGPTHQPVEHLASLRAMPNLLLFRPADAVEVAECWALALQHRERPSVLALTRQAVPTLRTAHVGDNLSARGGYELLAATGTARATLLATGSEVAVAAGARELLQAGGVPTRVVSLPCFKLFFAQGDAYREAVLGPGTVRVGVEAAVRQGWEPLLGEAGGFVGMTGFGASAPGADLYRHFGLTPEAVAAAARARL
jgi:transketolase